MNSNSPDPSELQAQREAFLGQFRAHLHLVITAHQTGQAKKLKSLAGPDLMDYCRELAEWPDHPLASELAGPITAVLQELNEIMPRCQGTLHRQDEKSKALHGSAQRILAQIDLAFGFILRNLNHQVAYRGEVTTDSGFLGEALYADTHAGSRVADMIRRYYRAYPEEAAEEEGGYAADYAWDVYQRVAELDRLADEFPQQVGRAARQMHAWPMLMHRHTNNRRRFSELARKLELGSEYPTDATEGARYRPDTPMVQYLDPLIYRLNVACQELGDREFKSAEDEQHWLYMAWWSRQEDRPNEEVLAAIHAAQRLPPLTKATALQWAEKAIVPLILVTDARDYKACTEPALRKIASQKGVKSRATFKSRLRAAVTVTLRRLARPA